MTDKQFRVIEKRIHEFGVNKTVVDGACAILKNFSWAVAPSYVQFLGGIKFYWGLTKVSNERIYPEICILPTGQILYGSYYEGQIQYNSASDVTFPYSISKAVKDTECDIKLADKL